MADPKAASAGGGQTPTELSGQVLVIGAGPVGMVAALDLAARGIDVILAERNGPETPVLPKTNHISARTLEIFRRLGFADAVRAKGLPDEFPNDVAFVTTLTGYELARLPIPSRMHRHARSGYIDAGWPTPEPAHRCNQMYFEPVIRARVLASPRIKVLWNTEIADFTQDAHGVAAVGRHTGDGKPISIRADYLIGCEGGRSMTRKKIGGVFSGVGIISHNRMVLVRAPGLITRLSYKPAWMTWFMTPAGHGSVHAIDGRELWCFTFTLPAGETNLDAIEPSKAITAAVGEEIAFEIVQQLDWVGRRLVSDRFGEGRAFIAGDASHIWIPMAGYGMNAGIADAANLTWKLAAVLHGWADPEILETYGPERLPVTQQVSHYVAAVAVENYGHDIRKNPPPALYEEGAEGEQARADARAFLIRANIDQFNCIGLNFGSSYAGSALIASDGEAPPPFMLGSYVPSTVPGCRTPHIFLADGVSLYDRLGPDFTLLRFDPTLDVAPLCAAAAARGVPLLVLDLDPAEAGDVYDMPLVLSRPDQFIAWRGANTPADPLALIDRVRGAGVRARTQEDAPVLAARG